MAKFYTDVCIVGRGGGYKLTPHHKNICVKFRHFVEQYLRSLWMIEWINFIFTRWSFQDTKLLGWTRKETIWSRGTNSRLAFAVNVTLNREVKHHVYVKRQTRIYTTWPTIRFTCRLLFIISAPKLVVSRNFLSIRIVLSCYYLLIFYLENFSTLTWRLPSFYYVTSYRRKMWLLYLFTFFPSLGDIQERSVCCWGCFTGYV